jgi:hypothetical protein
MTDYTVVLFKNYPNAKWTLDGDNYEGLNWLDDSPKPSKKTLDDAWTSYVADAKREEAAREKTRSDLLDRLGITADEAKLLLG